MAMVGTIMRMPSQWSSSIQQVSLMSQNTMCRFSCLRICSGATIGNENRIFSVISDGCAQTTRVKQSRIFFWAPGRAAAGSAVAPVLCRKKGRRQRNQALHVPGAGPGLLLQIKRLAEALETGLGLDHAWKPVAEAFETGLGLDHASKPLAAAFETGIRFGSCMETGG